MIRFCMLTVAAGLTLGLMAYAGSSQKGSGCRCCAICIEYGCGACPGCVAGDCATCADCGACCAQK